MLIKLLQSAARGDRVPFTSDYGSGIAKWQGPAQPTGSRVDVELEVKDEISWSKIVIGPASATGFERRENGMSIHGIVEDLDQNDVLSLRTDGTIVLIDTTGDPPLDVTGREVTLIADDVEMYPTDI